MTMHIELDVHPKTLDEQCDLLEEICEIAVRSAIAEIEGAPEDTYPCCVKCGQLQFRPVPYMRGVRNAPLTDAQRRALESTVTHGHPTHDQIHQLEQILQAHQMGTRIQSVAELARRKSGTSLDIAVFQCAQERLHGRPCEVALDYDESDGNLHAWIKYPDGTLKNPQDDTVPGGPACGCGKDHGGGDG